MSSSGRAVCTRQGWSWPADNKDRIRDLGSVDKSVFEDLPMWVGELEYVEEDSVSPFLRSRFDPLARPLDRLSLDHGQEPDLTCVDVDYRPAPLLVTFGTPLAPPNEQGRVQAEGCRRAGPVVIGVYECAPVRDHSVVDSVQVTAPVRGSTQRRCARGGHHVRSPTVGPVRSSLSTRRRSLEPAR